MGGTRVSAAIPLGFACISYALIVRPVLRGRLDAALLLLVACVAIQLVPLPTALVSVLSPHVAEVRAALVLTPVVPTVVRPLSIRASETEWALMVIGGAVAVFFVARAGYARSGVRRTVRGIALIGLAVSLLAIAQAATAGRYIFWMFRTEFEGPLPFGPFVNRNHFATWVLMALPVTIGYLAAHSESVRPRQLVSLNPRARVKYLVDPRAAWLFASAAMMLLALLLSLSRSGMMALAASATLTVLLSRGRITARSRSYLVAAASLMVIAAIGWADVRAIAQRLTSTTTGLASRLTIWRETLPIVRDFWLTGAGAGTYQTAMFVYQRSDRVVYFNQAHNHYLQVAAEGGLLLIVPLWLSLWATVSGAVDVLRRDRTPMWWIRTGAACGLGAVALQSLWETGLVMPANALLAAMLTALLLHEQDEQRVSSAAPSGQSGASPDTGATATRSREAQRPGDQGRSRGTNLRTWRQYSV